MDSRLMGRIVDAVAALVSIGAGLYLLSKGSAQVADSSGQSWFEVIAHGMGAYFVAKGIYMFRSSEQRRDQITAVEKAAAAAAARQPIAAASTAPEARR